MSVQEDVTSDEYLEGKARWRSRRGLLELDLLLYPFAHRHVSTLDVVMKPAYVALLECEDMEILDWIQDRDVVPPEFLQIVAIIRGRMIPGAQ